MRQYSFNGLIFRRKHKPICPFYEDNERVVFLTVDVLEGIKGGKDANFPFRGVTAAKNCYCFHLSSLL